MNVLFVCHEGSRTGAPLLLLWLVTWLIRNTAIRPHVVVLRDGPLTAAFAAVCPTVAWAPPPPYRPLRHRLGDRLSGRRGGSSPGELLERTIRSVDPEVVYLNSLVIGRHLIALSEASRRRPFLSHVHELNFTLLTQSTAEDVRRQLELSEVLLCCSPPVRDLLVNSYGVDAGSTVVVHEYLPFRSAAELAGKLGTAGQDDPLRQRIAAAKQRGALVFGCSGSPIMRKGFDLFPALLRACAASFGNGDFLGVWLGCAAGSEARLMAQTDIDHLGLQHHALLIPPLAEPLPVVHDFDVFALLSREDPYPLVALEAAALGIPTLCFAHSGGIVDFVAGDAGLVIDYLDLDQFARELHRLREDPRRRRALGEAARRKVFARHTVETAAATITEVLDTLRSSGRQAVRSG